MVESSPSEFQGRIAGGKDWREIVAWVGDLPPMPQVASRAIKMVENPGTTAVELNELLSSDAALAARVLKIANSAMFSRQREITTLTQAIMIIGFKALKGIIVAATLRQLNKGSGNGQKMVWEHSMFTAAAATTICKRLRKPYVEEIFLLGLLNSLGQIVLLIQPETERQYASVFTAIKSQQLDYSAAEQAVFGFAHPLIGALVAKKWNFSAESCQIILHYTDPVDDAAPENPLDEKIGIVRLADLIAHACKIGSPEGYPDTTQQIHKAALYVGFNPATVDSELSEVQRLTLEQFNAERHMFS